MRKAIVGLMLCVMLVGCGQRYLDPTEIVASIDSRDPELSKKFEQLGEELDEFRQMISMSVMFEMLGRKEASEFAKRTAIPSYYYNLGWIAVIEKRKDAREIYELGRKLLDEQIREFEAAIKKNAPVKPNGFNRNSNRTF